MLPFLGLSQSGGNSKKLLKKARKELSEENYPGAKTAYAELLKVDPNKSQHQFETGLAWFRSDVQKENALIYFERALQLSGQDTIPELLLYLGKTYHYTHQFDKAIYYYNSFRRFVQNDEEGRIVSKEISRFIEMCNSGIDLQEKGGTKFDIRNIGDRVNSSYPDYAPVFKQDESLLIFTSRREGSTGGQLFYDSKYFEDIYASPKADSLQFAFPTKFDSAGIYISSKINTKTHDAAIGFNADETKLFIYRDNDIWQSEQINGVWTDPVRMNRNVNTKQHEPSIHITPNEKILFIVSTREGGFGGRDLYVSYQQEDGTWGPAINLGEDINTPEDEDAPFLSSDLQTFYFSSKGHNSIGGYDIFKCPHSNGVFGDPINMGIPINSAGDDIYFHVDINNTFGYFASSRVGGYGDMDIYRIQLGCKDIPNTELRGTILAGERQLPAFGRITIKEKSSGKIVGNYTSNPYSGRYVIVLPPNNTYDMEVEVEGFEAGDVHKQTFTLPKQCEFFPLYQEINIRRVRDSIENAMAQESKFRNAFFNLNNEITSTYALRKLPESESGIDQLQNPDHYLMISGNIRHNSVIPGKGLIIYLVNSKNEIIYSTTSDEHGFFQFMFIDPKEPYKILVDETSARISYFGDTKEGATAEITLEGRLEQTDLRSRNTTGLANTEIYFVDDNKQITHLSKTNDKGNFKFGKKADLNKDLNRLNQEMAFIYRIKADDINILYGSYIRTIQPGKTGLEYSEFIDRLFLEKLAKEVPAFENIYFDFDKFFLRNRSVEILDIIYAFMVANPEVTIAIDGHCDNIGTEDYNMGLSSRRSNSTYTFLVSKGIAKSRIKSAWHGESRPAAANAYPDGKDNPEGRQLNRRVEFKIDIPGMAQVTLSY
ncbi:MAG TPA: OmpA family protein [Flavobacteriales bacterium]|nr:OmpA family protein [Flavobacteriales bacterium]HRJ39331.1 OmpA family protein [Flavobacteriales bacterium]